MKPSFFFFKSVYSVTQHVPKFEQLIQNNIHKQLRKVVKGCWNTLIFYYKKPVYKKLGLQRAKK